PARGPGQAAPRTVSTLKRTSSTVIGAPSDQRAPGRSVNVADRPSGASLTEASSASHPTSRPPGSTRNSCGRTSPRIASPASVRDFGSNGSRLAGSAGTPSRSAAAPAPTPPASPPSRTSTLRRDAGIHRGCSLPPERRTRPRPRPPRRRPGAAGARRSLRRRRERHGRPVERPERVDGEALYPGRRHDAGLELADRDDDVLVEHQLLRLQVQAE